MSTQTDVLDTRTTAEQMGEAAERLIALLSPDQRTKAILNFSNQEQRTRWYYTPVARDGLPLSEMDRRQRRRAHQLLATGLSRAGYSTASTIIGLETTLDALEGWHRPHPGRDPDLYYVSIFGRPDARQPWGWRFEGHHISLNYTLAGGQVLSPTPTFFGSNPAETALSPAGTLRPLAGIEDLARELIHAFDPAQRSRAILATAAPSDIVLANLPGVVQGTLPSANRVSPRQQEALRYTHAPKGLAAAAMEPAQREILLALVSEYIHRLPDEVAEIEMHELERRGREGLHFAWAGGLEKRQGHYYRIQGTRFLVEYDNTQNDANHIHSVWREPGNDFGARLLAEHYARDH
jgi:hypothetical protein